MDDHDHMESLSCLSRGEIYIYFYESRGEIFDCKGIGHKLLYALLVKRNMEESFLFFLITIWRNSWSN